MHLSHYQLLHDELLQKLTESEAAAMSLCTVTLWVRSSDRGMGRESGSVLHCLELGKINHLRVAGMVRPAIAVSGDWNHLEGLCLALDSAGRMAERLGLRGTVNYCAYRCPLQVASASHSMKAEFPGGGPQD